MEIVMVIFKVIPKSTVIGFVFVTIVIIICSICLLMSPEKDIESAALNLTEDWDSYIKNLFEVKNNCMLDRNFDTLKTIYVTDENKGKYAYENEILRSDYLLNWAKKQGSVLLDIKSKIKLLKCKEVGRGYAFYMFCSTEYTYAYADAIEDVNIFTLGAYHSLDLIPGTENGKWVISREWYDDAFMKSFNEYQDIDGMAQYIAGHQSERSLDLDEKRISAVKYADTYSGAVLDGQSFGYNSDYTNYNTLGGDCANFASQVLYEGGGFKKNTSWNYKAGKGSFAWIKARGLKDYLLYNGKGSLIANGKYEDVYKLAYELLPGDMIFYANKGKLSHVSVVTGFDSKGYPLVNSHNLDRYRVPWDIGWNTDKITYFFVRVHY